MKKIAAVAMLAAGMVVTPAKGAEIGLLFDSQMGKAQTLTQAFGAPSNGQSFDKATLNGVGIRGGVSVLDLVVADLSITATYHPKVSADLKLDGQEVGTFSQSYAAIGAQVEWKLLVNLNVGVDLRQEKLTSQLDGGPETDTTLTRPWIRAGLGWSLPLPVVSPFVRVEAAMPANSKSTGNMTAFTQAMAPQFQVGIYAGIRF
jgi:hypothetical protein